LRAYGTMALERCFRHAEHRLFRRVRIGDEAAIDDVGGAGDFRQRCSDEAAGAGLSRGNLQAAGAETIEHALGCRAQRIIDHDALHGSRTVAVAIATMPSPRPVKPSFSLVVALIATRPIAMPVIAAMRTRIASRCG